ncbi:alpha/beta fold hydrolase [Cohnella cholangitidis]|nr:alpha/beta hydrolase [Cohnella cholangitidis]
MNIRNLIYKGVEIPYRIHANEGKETILLLHPAFADYRIFEYQIAGFKERYQLILIDLPGHGNSPIRSSAITLKDVPELCNRIMDDNGIDQCHILGVSLGSLVAQAIADRYPQRVRSVTIVGGYSIHKDNTPILKAQRKEMLRWTFYILFSMRKFRKYVLNVSCHTNHGRQLFQQGIQHFNRKSFAAMSGMNAFFTPKSAPMPYPLLIIVGDKDLQLANDAALSLHQAEPRSRMATIAEAGHCANADAPEKFNAIVLDFLRSATYNTLK